MLISAFALLIAFFSESMRRDKTGCEKDNSGMIHIRMMRETPGKKKKKKKLLYQEMVLGKLLYYATDFSLLSFNDHLLASSLGLHPVEIALRWLFTRVGRCLIPNPMLPCWTRQQLLGNALIGQREKQRKSRIFILSAWIVGFCWSFSWGSNKGLTTGNRPTGKFR